VRVLAEDIGEALGCGAHLAALRRTATGGFDIADAIPLDRLEAMTEEERDEALHPVATLVADLPRILIGDDDSRRFSQGQPLTVATEPEGEHAVFCGTRLVGLADVAAGVARPRRVVAHGAAPA
jgi:tRNA pseudouridine55 synthase